METVKVLDCTLRDGGYCNQWRFGYQNTQKVIHALEKAGVDIIECGFLTNAVIYDKETTRFTKVEQIAPLLPKERQNRLYVCMINYGEFDLESLPVNDGTTIDGIRLAFHKKDLDDALEWGKVILQKGYKLFIQAMVSMSYSDNEFLDLIEKINRISPYAFYIVDSFGEMKRKDLTRFFYLVEHNLHPDIVIGYHAHNNMQMAFANAQALVDIPVRRDLIIDSSIYGMGRGAGNLNTELFVDYLNDTAEGAYDIRPILKVIDEVLEGFYYTGKWGYSLPNYLSASHHCHPNYALYLDDKKTLTVGDINEIFSMFAKEKCGAYDKDYIESLYLNYMGRGEQFEQHLSEISALLRGKRVLVIAPGQSAETAAAQISECAGASDVVSISINFDFAYCSTDLIFLSNLRRFQKLDPEKWPKTIVTSNIPCENTFLRVDYTQLLNDDEAVRDNAGMMLIQFLIQLGVKDIILAGMDGYAHDQDENYMQSGMQLAIRRAVLDEMNRGMERVLSKFAREVHIRFLTEPRHVHI